jgi:antitoxin component YwqK of YwqJK toxin-antitoxin module
MVKTACILAGIVCIMHAVSGDPEPAREYFAGGAVRKEIFEDGHTLVQKEYFPDGRVKYIQTLNQKTKKKVTVTYYPDGSLKSRLVQKPALQGSLVGKWEFFGNDGVRESVQMLRDGRFMSTEHFRDFTTKNSSGSFIIEINYKKGKWKGRGGNFTRIFDANGTLLNETPLDESQRWKK